MEKITAVVSLTILIASSFWDTGTYVTAQSANVTASSRTNGSSHFPVDSAANASEPNRKRSRWVPTTTEDPLLDATLDPRLETDPLDLAEVIMLNDFLGGSIVGAIEVYQMSRMANIPLPHERIGPAPPMPPAPEGAPAAAPSPPNLLPLYLTLLNQQRPAIGHGIRGSGEGGGGSGGGSFGDDPSALGREG